MYIYVCIYICIYTYTYVYIYTYIRVFVCTYVSNRRDCNADGSPPEFPPGGVGMPNQPYVSVTYERVMSRLNE